MSTQAALTSPQPVFLKPIWVALLGPPWVVSLVVLAVLAAVRFFAVLSPYSLQELYLLQTVAMWALPFLFLTASGRRQIGLTERGLSPGSLLLSALGGATCGLIFFALGMAIYGNSPNNWCISIRNYLHFDEMRGLMSPLGLFGIYSMPAIFLNPVGEEILFRGFIQESFARRFNPVFATVVNSVFFGLMYLSLHGLWHDASGYHIRLASVALALVLMACIGAVFTACRTLSGSLWASMAAHAAFNLMLLGAAIREFFR
ncbi:MAG TPA: CPBP family intramembrane glutamic endopeptidase [Terracidiphilus sp.]|nr:CPBP family intramembrane glutamic endopeptidase [Terracidiphilus sp.]